MPLLPVLYRPLLRLQVGPFLHRLNGLPSVFPRHFDKGPPRVRRVDPLRPILVPCSRGVRQSANRRGGGRRTSPEVTPRRGAKGGVLHVPKGRHTIRVRGHYTSFFPVIHRTFVLCPFPLALGARLFRCSPLGTRGPNHQGTAKILGRVRGRVGVGKDEVPQ